MHLMTVGAILLVLTVSTGSAAADSATPPLLRTVDRVDLGRYSGTWYEIARYPNRFQRDCDSDTMAEYTVLKDGKVQVVNSCRQKDGKKKTVRGTAKVADKASNAKLRVTFFWPFYGDYWIIGLSPDYRYAIVGEPKRNYLWILCRTPEMDGTTYQEIVEKIRAAGYDPGKLIKTRRSQGNSGALDGFFTNDGINAMGITPRLSCSIITTSSLNSPCAPTTSARYWGRHGRTASISRWERREESRPMACGVTASSTTR